MSKIQELDDFVTASAPIHPIRRGEKCISASASDSAPDSDLDSDDPSPRGSAWAIRGSGAATGSKTSKPSTRMRIIETHPELAFLALRQQQFSEAETGPLRSSRESSKATPTLTPTPEATPPAPALNSKKTRVGRRERQELLSSSCAFCSVDAFAGDTRLNIRRAKNGAKDAKVDANANANPGLDSQTTWRLPRVSGRGVRCALGLDSESEEQRHQQQPEQHHEHQSKSEVSASASAENEKKKKKKKSEETTAVSVPRDDALDALVCAWTARRFWWGEAEGLGGRGCGEGGCGEPEVDKDVGIDERGLNMIIWR